MSILTSDSKGNSKSNQSSVRTNLDSIYNKKLINNSSEKTNSNGKKQRKINFYLALKSLNLNQSNNNLFSNLSEFTAINPDNTKDENISKYLHHPITKDIFKIGNQLIKRKNAYSYKISNGLEINSKPLVTVYDMKNIFETINDTFIVVDRKYSNNYETGNDIKNGYKFSQMHKKNKSSITNYYFNENKSFGNFNFNNYLNKNKKYINHNRKNITV